MKDKHVKFTNWEYDIEFKGRILDTPKIYSEHKGIIIDIINNKKTKYLIAEDGTNKVFVVEPMNILEILN